MKKINISIVRLSCRKEKKAIKNHPCKKTRRGRYIYNVMNSYYDNGSIGIGYHNGCEIFQHDKDYEHPKGHFFEGLINGTTPWRYNENKYPQEEYVYTLEEVMDLFD